MPRNNNKKPKDLVPYSAYDFPDIEIKEDTKVNLKKEAKKEDVKRETKKEDLKREAKPTPKEVPQKKKRPQRKEQEKNILENDDENIEQPPMNKIQTKGRKKNGVKTKKSIEIFVSQCEEAREKTNKCLDTQLTAENNFALEYQKKIGAVLQQWETDIQHAKEIEDKINKQLAEEQRKLEEINEANNSWFETLKKVHGKFMESCKENTESCSRTYNSAKQEMEKNLKEAGKKLI